MIRFALLLRGINVGGKHKVVMAQLRQELPELGLENVETYINSGNIFFATSIPKAQLVGILQVFFDKHYPFIQHFSLFSQEDYEEECRHLPKWWSQDLARKDMLFYTEGLDPKQVIEKLSEGTYTKTAYHKYLLKLPFYRQITIRNAKTFDKIGQFLK